MKNSHATEQLNFLDNLAAAPNPVPSLSALWTPDQIYECDDPTLLLRLKEDDRFEKKSWRIEPKDIAPAFSAFSNGPSVRGGVVAFGIANKAPDFEGCSRLSEDRLSAIEACFHIHCPDAKVRCRRVPVKIAGKDDFIILFRISYNHDKLVCLTNGDAYERISDRTVRLDDGRKQQLRVDKGERQFETEVTTLNYPAQFDTSAISAFCDRVRTSRGTSAQHGTTQILESMRLGTHAENVFVPNNACVLLFAKDPRWAFPGAIVHFLKYRGIEELSGKAFNVEKDRQIEGRISEVIREAAAVIDANLREFTVWNGSRFETSTEYPRDAWYELLVNACVHRSYMSRTMPIFIKMFDDRLVFQSPGGLMPGVTPENIFEKHHPRNRIIMDALRETGEVRCINEGTKRVRIEMARMQLSPPEFREEPGEGAVFRAILRNDIAQRTTTLGPEAQRLFGAYPPSELTLEEVLIVNFVAESGRATCTDVMSRLGDTRWHTTRVKLQRLVDRGVLTLSSTKPRDRTAAYQVRPGRLP